MKLYELDGEMRSIFALLDDEETEFGEERAARLEAAFEQVDKARDAKLENLGLYIKNADAETEAIRAEEKRLAERRRSKERKAEWLKRYAAQSVRLFGAVETPRVKLTVRESRSVEITDAEALPDDYVTVKVERVPNKAEMLKAMKEGELIDGAELRTNYNLQVK
jgi:hypothetical protein